LGDTGSVFADCASSLPSLGCPIKTAGELDRADLLPAGPTPTPFLLSLVLSVAALLELGGLPTPPPCCCRSWLLVLLLVLGGEGVAEDEGILLLGRPRRRTCM